MTLPTHLVVSLPQNAQDGQEQVQNIQVQSDRCPDVFIICKPLNQVVCVIYNVSTENYSTHCTVNSTSCRSEREEHLQMDKASKVRATK